MSQVFFNILMRVFAWAVTFGLGSFLFNLGVGFTVWVGMDFVMDGVLSVIQSNITGLPSDLLAILQLMGFSTGLSLLASAMATGVGIRMLTKKSTFGKIDA